MKLIGLIKQAQGHDERSISILQIEDKDFS